MSSISRWPSFAASVEAAGLPFRAWGHNAQSRGRPRVFATWLEPSETRHDIRALSTSGNGRFGGGSPRQSSGTKQARPRSTYAAGPRPRLVTSVLDCPSLSPYPRTGAKSGSRSMTEGSPMATAVRAKDGMDKGSQGVDPLHRSLVPRLSISKPPSARTGQNGRSRAKYRAACYLTNALLSSYCLPSESQPVFDGEDPRGQSTPSIPLSRLPTGPRRM